MDQTHIFVSKWFINTTTENNLAKNIISNPFNFIIREIIVNSKFPHWLKVCPNECICKHNCFKFKTIIYNTEFYKNIVCNFNKIRSNPSKLCHNEKRNIYNMSEQCNLSTYDENIDIDFTRLTKSDIVEKSVYPIWMKNNIEFFKDLLIEYVDTDILNDIQENITLQSEIEELW